MRGRREVAGRGLSVPSPSPKPRYSCDTARRLTRERRNDWNLNVDYVLDASGNRAAIKWPRTFQASYVNGLGRITSVATPTLTLRTYAWDYPSPRAGRSCATAPRRKPVPLETCSAGTNDGSYSWRERPHQDRLLFSPQRFG